TTADGGRSGTSLSFSPLGITLTTPATLGAGTTAYAIFSVFKNNARAINDNLTLSIYATNVRGATTGGTLIATNPALSYNPDTGAISLDYTAKNVLLGLAPAPYTKPVQEFFYVAIDNKHD